MNVVEVAQSLSGMNSVSVSQVPENFRELAEKERIYIYNVSHKTWLQQTGMGRFSIPACPKNKAYILAVNLPKMMAETVMVDFKKQEQRLVAGMDVAKDIVGIGFGNRIDQSLLTWGCFISESFPPTDKEVEAANAALDKRALELVAEAEVFWMEGPLSHRNISSDHRWADTRMNAGSAWAARRVKMQECPGCGESVKVGILKHPGCGYIFDKAAWAEHSSEKPKAEAKA